MKPFALLTIIAILLPSLAAGQVRPDSGAFITRLGTDTIAVERFHWTASAIEGDLVSLTPRTRLRHYRIDLDARGRMTRFEMSAFQGHITPGMNPGAGRQAILSDSILATTVLRNGIVDTTLSARLIEHGAVLPWIQDVLGISEYIVALSRTAPVDSFPMDMFAIGPQGLFPTWVLRRGADSVIIDLGGSPLHARVDGRGRLLGVSARATTVRTETVRLPTLDVERIYEQWIAREAAIGLAGSPSVRDTVKATLGGVAVTVDYGRPRRRGRIIWGSPLVPWGEVWRTGANAATGLVLSGDLRIGGKLVPAGKYTVWSVPTPAGGELIINRQTGQWGTQYDSTQNFVRIPLEVRKLPKREEVEQFTIAVSPTGSGTGLLLLQWDTREYRVPIASVPSPL